MSSSQSQSKKTMTWATIVSIPKTTVDNAKKIPNRLENILVDMALEKKKKIEQAKQAKQAKQIILQRQWERKEQEIKMEEQPQTETNNFPTKQCAAPLPSELHICPTLCSGIAQKTSSPNAKKQLTKTQVRKYQTEQKRRKREEENAKCWEEIEKLVFKM